MGHVLHPSKLFWWMLACHRFRNGRATILPLAAAARPLLPEGPMSFPAAFSRITYMRKPRPIR